MANFCLSGGGVKGIAHLGALKALQENGVKFESFSGTSFGALVACAVNFGLDYQDFLDRTKSFSLFDPKGIAWSKRGVLNHKKVMNVLKDTFGNTKLEDLNNETWICYTDFDEGRPVYVNKGPLVEALSATMSIPGMFLPVKINGKNCYDGGLTDNLPVTPLINSGKKPIVGLNCNPRKSTGEKTNIRDILERTFLLVVNGNVTPQTEKCDIYLELEPMANVRAIDFKSVDKAFNEGYQFTKDNIDKFETIIPK
ncbi:patatin-like phospholipase family protein [Mangrovivirga sp. M17]|uniref:Patatin-like phospholipase family protein n=1 Tax=Mangrovivirga halotolerans TaxID=2993936 RepID=A0ABT3RRH6_9BACT|nr:patatin-like phospholipase family protein [Mangrovivirga halotolerans]MCX2743968.1 patatin-like phospholipase family protein [Mangrovivirga halotolerans]